ncbi:MAG: hypothetical protein JWO15_1396 [Sphingomonadales bacterium]|nr:hypothetical protein [Sphingomonadales bacterium]
MRTFESFKVGKQLGRVQYTLDQAMLDDWQAVYGPVLDRRHLPAGLTTALIMRAYCEIVDDRPPGNINVGNDTALYGSFATDDIAEIEVRVASTRATTTRKIVAFEVLVSRFPTPETIARAVITLFWAM